ncbi:PAS domain-containing protein [Siccirubricoccus deserti]
MWGSPQWVAYSGLSEEESVGLGWLDAIHPDDRAATMTAWAEAEVRGLFSVEHRTFHAADRTWRCSRAVPRRCGTRRAASLSGSAPRPTSTIRCAPARCWPAARKSWRRRSPRAPQSCKMLWPACRQRWRSASRPKRPCGRRRKWTQWASSRAVLRTTSTTCSRASRAAWTWRDAGSPMAGSRRYSASSIRRARRWTELPD